MSNEQMLTIENPNINTNNPFNNRNIKDKFNKIISYLKPTIFNSAFTFIAFIIILAIIKKLGLSLLLTIVTYVAISFLVQPFLGSKIQNGINGSNRLKNKKPSLINSNNKSTILLSKDRTMIGISLLKAEWLGNYLNLNSVWDLLQQEGIQIQDCREGCFFIIRKNVELKRGNNLQEIAVKLVKEIEKCILLLKKRVDIEYENLSLYLVKGQRRILTILNLGLEPSKFTSNQDLSDEDLDYISSSSLDNQEISIEEE